MKQKGSRSRGGQSETPRVGKDIGWLHNSQGAMTLVVDDSPVVWGDASFVVQIRPYTFFTGESHANNAPGNRNVALVAAAEPAEAPIPRTEASDSSASPTQTVSHPKPNASTIKATNQAVKHEFNGRMHSFTEESDPVLPAVLRLIRCVHSTYFKQLASNAAQAPNTADILQSVRLQRLISALVLTILQILGSILRGARVLFTGVIPSTEDPRRSKLGRLVLQHGGQ